jgi:hypothetical protein
VQTSTAEKTPVNRPLSAFGALLTLLAVAMFAVSSTTRSTTVQPPLPGNRRVKLSGERGRIALARLMPASQFDYAGGSDEELGDETGLCSPDSIEIQNVAIADGDELKPLAAMTGVDRQPLIAARIEVASNALEALRTPPPMDCRSGHDAVYDRAVYGVSDDVTGRAEPALMEAGRVDDAELASIFHGLVSRQPCKPLPQAGIRSLRGIRIRWQAPTAAVGNWMNYHISATLDGLRQKIGMSAPRVEWADYVDFADRVSSRAVITAELERTSDAGGSVRSGDWLRHSAASSLYRMGLVLQAAAAELGQTEGPFAMSAAGTETQ